MKHLMALVGCAVLVCAPAFAQATKTVKGSVTSVAGSSVTVNVAGKDMTFAVDAKTRVVAPGAGTKARTAEAAGKSGPALTDVVKTGQAVEVVYHQQGMHADSVRAIAAVPTPSRAAGVKAQTATGVVSAVTGNSLTLHDTTYTVDNKTTVSGPGMGTAGRKLLEAGGKPTLAEFVKPGDTVTVRYHDVSGARTVSVVRVVRKKIGTQ
jgi:hypothetical protein